MSSVTRASPGFSDPGLDVLPCVETSSLTLVFTFSLYVYEVLVFPWTNANSTFMIAHKDRISLGSGGSGAALSLDESLLNGSSSKCDTFGNECLSSGEHFQVHVCEVWGLGWKKLKSLHLGEPTGSFFKRD